MYVSDMTNCDPYRPWRSRLRIASPSPARCLTCRVQTQGRLVRWCCIAGKTAPSDVVLRQPCWIFRPVVVPTALHCRHPTASHQPTADCPLSSLSASVTQLSSRQSMFQPPRTHRRRSTLMQGHWQQPAAAAAAVLQVSQMPSSVPFLQLVL